MEKVYFVTSIDTDAGKSIITGVLAKYLLSTNVNVITQKIAQTGCEGISDDIQTHRRIMGIPLTEEDKNGHTCTYTFPFPSSPHLAAKLTGEEIKLSEITNTTRQLEKKFDTVLLEGVGGLMVPLNEDTLLIDYLSGQGYPTILVSNGKLGSINHTILSLDAMRRREINLKAIIYNNFIETDPIITSDTMQVLKRRLKSYYPSAQLIEFSHWDDDSTLPDLSTLFKD